jgi:hypothetical protein
VIGQQPPGWTRIEDEEGGPVWRHHTEPVSVTTQDMDLLRCLGAALVRFQDMGPEEFHLFVSPPPAFALPECTWTDFRNST